MSFAHSDPLIDLKKDTASKIWNHLSKKLKNQLAVVFALPNHAFALPSAEAGKSVYGAVGHGVALTDLVALQVLNVIILLLPAPRPPRGVTSSKRT